VLLPGWGWSSAWDLVSSSIGRLRDEPDPLGERAAFYFGYPRARKP
jgi:hypothetical protein